MSALLNNLLAKAAQLSLDERGQLVTALLASLDDDESDEADDPAAIEAAWRIEIAARLERIERGETQLVPGELVFERIRQRLT